MDHVIPRAHGGESKIWNLVACCPQCNCAKGCLSLEDFRLGVFNGATFWGELYSAALEGD